MKRASPRFCRLITTSLLILLPAATCKAGEPLPTGRAMEELRGVPYHLFARQRQTESLQAANCITAVIHALRRSGFQCRNGDFFRARRFWQTRARPLEPGKSPIGKLGALLFTHEHFLLLYADSNDNQVIDAEDTVIHAYYRPVEISRIAEWRKASPAYPIFYLPINADFPCIPPVTPTFSLPPADTAQALTSDTTTSLRDTP